MATPPIAKKPDLKIDISEPQTNAKKSRPQSPRYRMIKDEKARISFSSVSPPLSPRLLPKTPSSVDLSVSEEDSLKMKPKARPHGIERVLYFLDQLNDHPRYTPEFALIKTRSIFNRMTKIYPARCSRVWTDW